MKQVTITGKTIKGKLFRREVETLAIYGLLAVTRENDWSNLAITHIPTGLAAVTAIQNLRTAKAMCKKLSVLAWDTVKTPHSKKALLAIRNDVLAIVSKYAKGK